jgi:hypothetical protein
MVDMSWANQSALQLMTQHTAGVSGRTKHVDVQYHFVRDILELGALRARFVPTDVQLAGKVAQALPGPALGKGPHKICLCSPHQA